MTSARGYLRECSYPEGEKKVTMMRVSGIRRFRAAMIGFACSNSPSDDEWNQTRLPGGSAVIWTWRRGKSHRRPRMARRTFRLNTPNARASSRTKGMALVE